MDTVRPSTSPSNPSLNPPPPPPAFHIPLLSSPFPLLFHSQFFPKTISDQGMWQQQQPQEPDSLESPAPRRTPRDSRIGDSDDEISLDPSLQQMSVRASFVDVVSNSLELAPSQREQLHNLVGVGSIHQKLFDICFLPICVAFTGISAGHRRCNAIPP